MNGKDLEGRVAVVTGAARGQGRSHCIALAEAGADIIAIDVCRPDDAVSYPLATSGDLETTADLVRAAGRRATTGVADVANYDEVEAAVQAGREQLGRVDILCANAGIFGSGLGWEIAEEAWQRVLAVNLTGVWHAAKACIPSMISGGEGGAIVVTGSTASIKGVPNMVHYAAAKHGVVGMTRGLAIELAPHRIRANVVAPTACNTGMLHNDEVRLLFTGGVSMPTEEEFADANEAMHLLPTPWVEPADISAAVVFLASPEARFVTGAVLPVDAGYTTR